MTTSFPRTLSLLRQEKGLSQRVAAIELGVSQALLSHYENGIREPGLAFVARCSKYYNVTADYLLGLTMSRDGTGISAEDIHDISLDKENVLKGSMLATLNKKLLVNTLGVIYDILGKCASRPLINEASEYLSLTLYKLFRFLYRAGGKKPDGFFNVSDRSFSHLADAEIRLCELRMCSMLEGDPVADYSENSIPTVPELSNDMLASEYPLLISSLLTVLHKTGEILVETT